MSTLLPALSSVLFLLLLAHARTTAASTLEDTCKRYAGGDQAGHNYDYCMKTLGDDPVSASADALGLAAHATTNARSAAMATGARIARLLQAGERVPARRDCLRKCVAEYDATVRRLTLAARDARIGGGDELSEAQRLLSEALGAPLRCDKAFADAGQMSPLSKADCQVDEAVGLALSILPIPPATN
uniref:Uncharacterized protein n=1 Tax=Avena sativa TaxID=4498 RepID=A0ACD5WLL8_AVESA